MSKRFDDAIRPNGLSMDPKNKVTSGTGPCFTRNLSVSLRLQAKRFDSCRRKAAAMGHGLNRTSFVSAAASVA